MSERDDAVERIVEGLAGDMPDWHVQPCPGVLYRDKIRRAVEAGRLLGEVTPCTRAESWRQGLVEGARRMQERCEQDAVRAINRARSANEQHEGSAALKAIRALKPEDV